LRGYAERIDDHSREDESAGFKPPNR
jgi:hypothetical protein